MIRPPENEWFSRVLLYWDRVGTILPREYSSDQEFLRPYTSALLAAKLLTPIPPDESVWRSGADNYRESFLELVDSDPFGVERTRADERTWARVHLDKTGTGLALDLVQRGLAKDFQGPEDRAWVEVERRTAELLMAFLASIVGKDENVAMDPITDSEAAMAAFTKLPEASRQIETELEPIRYALLTEILPGPATGIEPKSLADFKADHHDLLVSFRNRLEQKAIDCAQVTDGRLRNAMLERVRGELADDLNEIEQRMGERRWPSAGGARLASPLPRSASPISV
jgi:hypothetical protein